MKLILATLILLAGTSSFANNSYEFEGISPVDGTDCVVSFNIEKGRYMRDLRLTGPHTRPSLTKADTIYGARVSSISSAVEGEIFTLRPAFLGSKYSASLDLSVRGVVTSKHKVTLEGENLESLESIEVNSKLGTGYFGASKVDFKCVGLREV